MKTVNKLQFGINAISAGQKSATVNATPQLIVNSTAGKFQITSPVSKALGIAVGDNVMFLNNISGVEQAIQNRVPEIVEIATELGADLDTREGELAVLEACTQWFIAKGVKKYTKTGEPVMASERFTKEDKKKYLAIHRMEIVEANRAALVEQFGEMSDEELAEQITADIIESPKYHAAEGSKTATTGNATGVGCQLNFTDSAIWNALKSDLGDAKEKKNRYFNVLLDNASKTTYNDGFKDVDITIYPIEFDTDKDPIIRGKKDAE